MNPTDPILHMMTQAKPFVKWAGGKSKLLPQLEAAFPPQIYTDKAITYIEPFVGGGAMLFHLLNKHIPFKHIIINDINDNLMNCYRHIKDSPKLLVKELRRIEQLHWSMPSENGKSELFYAHRDRFNNKQSISECERAALFLYLNHTCFNGLYRVNAKGAFNVPYGKRKNPIICNEERILADSELLNSVDIELLTGDYTQVEHYMEDGERTFMYIDPPYKPVSATANFKEYSNAPFNDKEQESLKDFCDRLSSRGTLLMLSNSDARDEEGESYFEKLYHGYHFRHVYAPRSINPLAEMRKRLPEILITNYPDHERKNHDSSQQP